MSTSITAIVTAFCAPSSLNVRSRKPLLLKPPYSHPLAPRLPRACASSNGQPYTHPQEQRPLLYRAALGEPVHRAPVWLMRQAGRYMREFRAYSDRIPFRGRSEDPHIARELSLQPWRAFRTDAVIMFSDILTPLPALGIDFDIIPGKGPLISTPIRTAHHQRHMSETHFNPAEKLPFIAELLQMLTEDLRGQDVTLIGFVGAPFTLAAYAIEGRTKKNLAQVKRMMYADDGSEEILRGVLEKISVAAAEYAIYQIDNGAHVLQLFDSWAHHLSPAQYAKYALPYAKKVVLEIKRARPHAALIFFANGAAGKLEDIHEQLDGIVDVIGLDWSVSMKDARRRLGNSVTLQGNIDPSILLTGSKQRIRQEVFDCLRDSRPGPLILNIGHGVIKETPEESVLAFCEAAREYTYELMDEKEPAAPSLVL